MRGRFLFVTGKSPDAREGHLCGFWVLFVPKFRFNSVSVKLRWRRAD